MKNNLLVIGIDQYVFSPRLNNCVRDASNIIDVLVNKYEFESSRVTTLFDTKATRHTIINEFETYLSNQNPNENLIVLFSGHGDYDDLMDMGYLLPSEGAFGDKPSSIANSTILDYVKVYKYKHLVLLFDSCFSGSVFTPNRGVIHTPKERLFEIPSKWALTSGRIQLVSDGSAGGNSPFAASVIQSLKSNTSEMLSISEVSRNVINDVSGMYTQIPRGEPLQLYGHRGGEFMFKLKKFKPHAKGKAAIEDDSNGELKNILSIYYEIQEKIEEAENGNKFATGNRLAEESNSIANFLRKEIIKVFEFEKQSKDFQGEINQVLGDAFVDKSKDIRKLYVQKLAELKKQNFEEAMVFRAKEKTAIEEVENMIKEKKDEIKHLLKLTEESIAHDYCVLILVGDILYRTSSTIVNYIENNFVNLYFLKISSDNGYITKYLFRDKHEMFTTRVITYIIAELLDQAEVSSEDGKSKEANLQNKVIPKLSGLEPRKVKDSR